VQELGAAWKSKKDPNVFIGKIGKVKIMVCPNKFKKADNHPDIRILVLPEDDKVDIKKDDMNLDTTSMANFDDNPPPAEDSDLPF